MYLFLSTSNSWDARRMTPGSSTVSGNLFVATTEYQRWQDGRRRGSGLGLGHLHWGQGLGSYEGLLLSLPSASASSAPRHCSSPHPLVGLPDFCPISFPCSHMIFSVNSRWASLGPEDLDITLALPLISQVTLGKPLSLSLILPTHKRQRTSLLCRMGTGVRSAHVRRAHSIQHTVHAERVLILAPLRDRSECQLLKVNRVSTVMLDT